MLQDYVGNLYGKRGDAARRKKGDGLIVAPDRAGISSRGLKERMAGSEAVTCGKAIRPFASLDIP
jgi:hypothetical protein